MRMLYLVSRLVLLFFSLLFFVSIPMVGQVLPTAPVKKETKSPPKTIPSAKNHLGTTRSPSTLPEMIFVEGGTFMMGSENGEVIEKPLHKVTVSSFFMSKYEVTFAQYDAFCDEMNHTKPTGDKC